MSNTSQQIELSKLTDQELLLEAKKKKSQSITNAFLIGFLIGVSIYGIFKNGLGFLAIIPIFLIYKLSNDSKYDKKELNRLLKERNLK